MSREERVPLDDEWVWEPKLVGPRVGTDYGRSRDGDGTESPNLFLPGARGVKAHAKIRDIDKDDDVRLSDPEPVYIYVDDESLGDTATEESSELGEALGALLVLGVIFAAQKAAPHLKRWWSDQALPFLKKTRAKLSRAPRAGSQVVAAESSALAEFAPAASSREVFAALDEYRASMSSTEARDRLVAALVARLFSEEQLRLLRNARIQDEGGALELASAMEMLTPHRLGASLTMMLDANPSWPDEGTLNELGKILGGRRGDGDGVPMESGWIKRALPLPGRGD